ncbi:hypothetical protein PR202_ga04248 [Eleusine coracana subsp. coracana]|uniref:EF-hand domain-containing protein n=1 Tax=Eleusine coracana subsp. coracana TaxID=191504 RepID=A0AAV5BRT5_ELECO|nr:hypothetical protein PR202_ga04248 [Eleusine coracana subsp. coracana]
MASNDRPLEAFLAAARGTIAQLHLPIQSPESISTRPKRQQREPDCLLHLHAVVTNFLHKPLRSLARCFRKQQRVREQSPPPHQLDLLLCIAFDAFAQNLQSLEGVCKQKGAELGIALPQWHQFQLLRKVIDGKRADFDGFLSGLGFAKVGAPPPASGIMGASPTTAPAALVSDHEDNSGTVQDNGGGAPQQQPQRLAARLLDVPLSNVERLRSTLLTVSLAELIELVPQLVGRSSTSADGHPDKKKLFSVQDFFRYAEVEGRRFFEELDRDGDGQVTLEDLEVAMRKRRLPRRYARDFLRRTRSNFFSKSIGWKQYLSLMEQKEATILRAYTTLCLSKSGTLHKNQILTSLKSAGLPANEDNAAAMLRYLNADSEGSISYGHFRNFMLLLPSERLEDDPRNVWFEAATVVAVPPPVEISTGSVLKSALVGGLASALSTSLMHPIDSMKVQQPASFHQHVSKRLHSHYQISFQSFHKLGFKDCIEDLSQRFLANFQGIFEASKLVLINVAPTLPEIQVQSVASFCSTVLGTAVRIPCEVLKQRLQAGIFNNVGEAIVGTMRQDGLKGFFRGTGATLCREVPLYVAGMCLYTEAKKAAQHVLDRELEPWETVSVGALSGGLAAIITTPFDVLKTRMMTAPPGTPVSMQMIIFSILQNEGPPGLFKGAIPRFFWVAPLGAMNFAGYELAKKAMIKEE